MGFRPALTPEKLRAEVNDSRGLHPSPFVCDIFTANGKGGWNYRNSITRYDIATPVAPTVRYLNNVTKQGFVFEIDQTGDKYTHSRKIYVSDNWDFTSVERDISMFNPPSRAGAVKYGFTRDTRGFAQLVKSERDCDEKADAGFETRTLHNWNADMRQWKAATSVIGDCRSQIRPVVL